MALNTATFSMCEPVLLPSMLYHNSSSNSATVTWIEEKLSNSSLTYYRFVVSHLWTNHPFPTLLFAMNNGWWMPLQQTGAVGACAINFSLITCCKRYFDLCITTFFCLLITIIVRPSADIKNHKQVGRIVLRLFILVGIKTWNCHKT